MQQLHSVEIFGVKVNPLTSAQAIAWSEDALHSSNLAHIVTPNTEMIVKARKNSTIRDNLNIGELHLPDSVGVVWALKSLYKESSERVAGADFSFQLCELANKNKLTVGLVGRADGLHSNSAKQAAERMSTSYPHASFKSFSKTAAETVSADEFAHIDILLVGMGAPDQDEWIEQHRVMLAKNGVRIAAGIGASIDFMAGVQKRAPKTFQKLKLEWLWRLIQQPSRLKRQLALPQFVCLVLLAKLGLNQK